MSLKTLASLVLVLIAGVLGSTHSYLAADRDFRATVPAQLGIPAQESAGGEANGCCSSTDAPCPTCPPESFGGVLALESELGGARRTTFGGRAKGFWEPCVEPQARPCEARGS